MSNHLPCGRLRPDPSADRTAPPSRSRFREANELMRDGLRHADPDFEIAFFCECDNPDCYAAVWLTGTAFEERLATSHPIVVTGHGPSVASKKPLS